MLSKYFRAKCHVRTDGRPLGIACLIIRVVEGKHTTQIVFALKRKPPWAIEFITGENATSGTSPLPTGQRSSQFMKPLAVDDDVVVGECEDFSQSFPDSRVSRMRQPLPRFVDVAETASVPAAKVLDYLARLIL